jgi:hemolysin III
MVAPFFVLQRLGFWLLPTRISISVSYAIMAALIALPLLIHLKLTRFKDGLLVVGMLCTFAIALLFRVADRNLAFASAFPMGTHWLWHIFSAIAVYYLISYVANQESPRSTS